MFEQERAFIVRPHMLPGYKPEMVTESYISSPPALWIINRAGTVFTLGYQYQELRDAPKGHYALNVFANGINTGEFATFIEMKGNRVRIRTAEGWKIWNGRSFV